MRVAILLVMMFGLAVATGVVTGRLTSRYPVPQRHQPGAAGGSPLSDQLQLSPEQSEQMRPVWEAARDTARSCAREAERVQREHERQLAAMLNDEQKQRYERLSEENHARIAELDAERKEAFREAVARTRKILRDDQWRAYKQMIKNQVGTMPDVADDAPATTATE
jgi:hypothetical protein